MARTTNPFTRLFRAITRRAPDAPQDIDVPWVANPGAVEDADTDPAGRPARGYPHHYFAIHHHLPLGEPIRGDELVWVATQVERMAAAGILDENNLHLLDAEITSRRNAWHHAISQSAKRRTFIIDGLISAQRGYLLIAKEQLTTARLRLKTLQSQHAHWAELLTGNHPALSRPVLAEIPHARSDSLEMPQSGQLVPTTTAPTTTDPAQPDIPSVAEVPERDTDAA